MGRTRAHLERAAQTTHPFEFEAAMMDVALSAYAAQINALDSGNAELAQAAGQIKDTARTRVRRALKLGIEAQSPDSRQLPRPALRS
jgi:hypothetical protein